jgi:ClpP class serine protease
MAKATKPSRAIVRGRADSAGYYLASQADEILAESRGSEVGSIGVVVTYFDVSEAMEREGVKEVTVTNQLSSEKRPDLATDEGMSVLVDRLDELYELFEERVVDGRSGNENFSLENVRSLKGRVVSADKGIKLGLIDGMAGDISYTENQPTTNDGGNMEGQTFAALCASNDELQPHVDGLVGAASASAQTAERERIEGLLAISHVELPKAVTDAIGAGMTKQDLAVKLCEDNKPTTNTEQVPPVAPAEGLQETVEKSELVDTDASDAAKLSAFLDNRYGKGE